MRAGVLFPPVRVVFRRDGAFIVQDGGTRAAASLRLGFSYIPAVANPQPWPNVPSWL
jgi:ParB-like chromosome segregation protein Spo0J